MFWALIFCRAAAAKPTGLTWPILCVTLSHGIR